MVGPYWLFDFDVIPVIIDRDKHIRRRSADWAAAIRIWDDDGATDGATILLDFVFGHGFILHGSIIK
jgi:hypothetical protein